MNTITIKSDNIHHNSFIKQVFINDLPLFEFRVIPNKQIEVHIDAGFLRIVG